MKIQELIKQKDSMRVFSLKAEKVEELEAERSIIHFISTPDLDRGRDIVDPKGMDATDFLKSPSVWYNHNYMWDPNAVPIGKAMWVKKKDDGVLAKTQFAETQFADDIYYMHKNDYVASWSIGWEPQRDPKTGQVKEGALIYDEGARKLFINKWVLFEYSSAPIAMNPDALDQMKEFIPLAKSFQTKEILKASLENFELESKILLVTNGLEELKSLVSDLQLLTDGNEKSIIEITNLINNEIENVTDDLKLEIDPNVFSREVNKEKIKRSVTNILKKY